MDGYSLSRQWFDFAFENPEKMSPEHTAIYLLAIELWNRFGQKEKFGFPAYNNMEAIGIKNHRTYKKYFDDLIDWGFIKLIQESKNQYSACVIALVKNTQPNTKAFDKANAKHGHSTASIDKQRNKETKKQVNTMREDFEKYKIENPDTVTTNVLIRFFEIGYIPAEKETIETFKEWLINVSKESGKSGDMIEKESFKWMTHYEHKKPKNYKSSFLNWLTREFVGQKSK